MEKRISQISQKAIEDLERELFQSYAKARALSASAPVEQQLFWRKVDAGLNDALVALSDMPYIKNNS